MPPLYFNIKLCDSEHWNNLNITAANCIMSQFGCRLTYYSSGFVLIYSASYCYSESDVNGNTKNSVIDMAVTLQKRYFDKGSASSSHGYKHQAQSTMDACMNIWE